MNEEEAKQEEDPTDHYQSPRKRHINWRSVWRFSDLDYEGTRLTVEPPTAAAAAATIPGDNRNLKLVDFGIIEDGARIRFVRRKFHKSQIAVRTKWTQGSVSDGSGKERKNKSR